MVRFVRARPVAALLAAVGLVIVGRLVDLQWHLSHDEFEGTSQQIRAHFVVWIAVLLLLSVTTIAIRESVAGFGFRLALGGALLYVPVAVWHFVEHATGDDPELAHVLLGLADVTIIAGGAVAALQAKRRGAPVSPVRRGQIR